jgi:arylsulfatase
VAAEYTPETQGKFTGGTIQYVEVSVEKEQYRDLEREMAAAMAVD